MAQTAAAELHCSAGGLKGGLAAKQAEQGVKMEQEAGGQKNGPKEFSEISAPARLVLPKMRQSQGAGKMIMDRDLQALEAWVNPRGFGRVTRAMDASARAELLCLAAAWGWEEGTRLLRPSAEALYAVAIEEGAGAGRARDGNDLSGRGGGSGVLYTALGFACLNGRVDCAKYLLDCDREDDARASEEDGLGAQPGPTPCRRMLKFIYGAQGSDLALHFAVESGLNVAARTLAMAGEPLNERDRSGTTAVFAAVAAKPGKNRAAREAAIECLCSLGAELDEPVGQLGKTALMLAVEQEDLAVAKILLAGGANPRARMTSGQTCLGIVAAGLESKMRQALAEELLARGAYPWTASEGALPEKTPLAEALEGGSGNIARSIAAAALESLENPSAAQERVQTWERERKLAREAGFPEIERLLDRFMAKQIEVRTKAAKDARLAEAARVEAEAEARRMEMEAEQKASECEQAKSFEAEQAWDAERSGPAEPEAWKVEKALEQINGRLAAIEEEAKGLREMVEELRKRLGLDAAPAAASQVGAKALMARSRLTAAVGDAGEAQRSAGKKVRDKGPAG